MQALRTQEPVPDIKEEPTVEHEVAARDLGLVAPRPEGALVGRRRYWRLQLARVIHFANGCMARTPLGKLFRKRLWGQLEIQYVKIPVSGKRLGIGLDVAFLSDLHAGFFMSPEDLESLAQRTTALSPDLICLGGDLVDSKPEQVELLDRFLRALEAPLGVFAVLGNHEYYPAGKVDGWIAFLEERGVNVLVNRGERVVFEGKSAWIAGVDDLTESEPDLERALEGRRWDEPTLLLSHHPDLFVEAATHDIDLQLSGHTHGGQVRFGNWQPIDHSEFGLNCGSFRHGDAHLFVGKGAGVTVAPLRVGAAPEISLVHWG